MEIQDRTNGERLRRLRGERSLEEVAKACNIRPSTLSQYERDLRNPRDNIKMRLANYYGKSVKYLFYTVNTHDM